VNAEHDGKTIGAKILGFLLEGLNEQTSLIFSAWCKILEVIPYFTH
jgi:hypothetical protein